MSRQNSQGPTLHTSLRKERVTPLTLKSARVVGGGGMTNTAVTREEKQLGYSPTKVIDFDLKEGKLRVDSELF